MPWLGMALMRQSKILDSQMTSDAQAIVTMAWRLRPQNEKKKAGGKQGAHSFDRKLLPYTCNVLPSTEAAATGGVQLSWRK